MFGVIMPLCNRMFCCIFGWYFFIKIRLKYEKIILLSSSRAFLLSTLIFLLSASTFQFSTPMDNSEATWNKATKCNKYTMYMYYDHSVAQPMVRRSFFKKLDLPKLFLGLTWGDLCMNLFDFQCQFRNQLNFFILQQMGLFLSTYIKVNPDLF